MLLAEALGTSNFTMQCGNGCGVDETVLLETINVHAVASHRFESHPKLRVEGQFKFLQQSHAKNISNPNINMKRLRKKNEE